MKSAQVSLRAVRFHSQLEFNCKSNRVWSGLPQSRFLWFSFQSLFIYIYICVYVSLSLALSLLLSLSLSIYPPTPPRGVLQGVWSIFGSSGPLLLSSPPGKIGVAETRGGSAKARRRPGTARHTPGTGPAQACETALECDCVLGLFLASIWCDFWCHVALIFVCFSFLFCELAFYRFLKEVLNKILTFEVAAGPKSH